MALVPPANLHLTSFHGVYAPHSNLRRLVLTPTAPPTARTDTTAKPRTRRPTLDWASLHRHTWGTDVLRCPCGGTRRIRAIHSTRALAEARLAQLGIRFASALPPATAPPPQLSLAV